MFLGKGRQQVVIEGKAHPCRIPGRCSPIPASGRDRAVRRSVLTSSVEEPTVSSHYEIDRASLAMSQAIVRIIDADPERVGIQLAQENCERWLSSHTTAA